MANYEQQQKRTNIKFEIKTATTIEKKKRDRKKTRRGKCKQSAPNGRAHVIEFVIH